MKVARVLSQILCIDKISYFLNLKKKGKIREDLFGLISFFYCQALRSREFTLSENQNSLNP